ncbi:MAG: AMP-binding protein, partial [Muribaculaceae bacterium]|nr:AMP-binding protein [Muribaculaceae bacterium]
FLRRIGFPYTIGYGMTECAPLISYCEWSTQKAGSCGKVVDRMEVRIDSPDPAHQAGTLWVNGDNVMLGYYKNPEATEAVMDVDGWMNTGDVVERDADGYLFIRGRDKSMILGPSGQNIYPEEIENVLNTLPFVAESLVVERDGKLVGLVVPDYDAAKKASISREKIDEIMDLNLAQLNRSVPAYSRVSSLELRDEPFEKTPKHSIRRFLYK